VGGTAVALVRSPQRQTRCHSGQLALERSRSRATPPDQCFASQRRRRYPSSTRLALRYWPTRTVRHESLGQQASPLPRSPRQSPSRARGAVHRPTATAATNALPCSPEVAPQRRYQRLYVWPRRQKAPARPLQQRNRCRGASPSPEQRPDKGRGRDHEPWQHRLVAAADHALDGQRLAPAAAGGHRGGLPGGGGEPPSLLHDEGQRLSPTVGDGECHGRPDDVADENVAPAASTERHPSRRNNGLDTHGRAAVLRASTTARSARIATSSAGTSGRDVYVCKTVASRALASYFACRCRGDGGSGRAARPHPRLRRVGVRVRHRHLRRRSRSRFFRQCRGGRNAIDAASEVESMSTKPTSGRSAPHSTVRAVRGLNTLHIDGVDTSNGSPADGQAPPDGAYESPSPLRDGTHARCSQMGLLLWPNGSAHQGRRAGITSLSSPRVATQFCFVGCSSSKRHIIDVVFLAQRRWLVTSSVWPEHHRHRVGGTVLKCTACAWRTHTCHAPTVAVAARHPRQRQAQRQRRQGRPPRPRQCLGGTKDPPPVAAPARGCRRSCYSRSEQPACAPPLALDAADSASTVVGIGMLP